MSRLDEVRAEAIRHAQEEIAAQVTDEIDSAIQGCESPIEELFAAAFAEVMVRDHSYFIGKQMPIGRHRVDFIVKLVWPNGYEVSVVVECDGHDWHEKTKEQAARDKKRDRDITAAGYSVMRFTGSELHKDPFACVEEVVSYTQGVAYERSMHDYKERQKGAGTLAQITEPGEDQ